MCICTSFFCFPLRLNTLSKFFLLKLQLLEYKLAWIRIRRRVNRRITRTQVVYTEGGLGNRVQACVVVLLADPVKEAEK